MKKYTFCVKDGDDLIGNYVNNSPKNACKKIVNRLLKNFVDMPEDFVFDEDILIKNKDTEKENLYNALAQKYEKPIEIKIGHRIINLKWKIKIIKLQ